MVRKGWSAVATPSGWYSVVRGPRPPPVQWPRQQPWGPQWSYPVQRPKVTEVKEGSPSKRRWQRGNVQGNPDEVQAAARSRVERLERALAILGEGDSAEIRGLQAALKEARRGAQDRPLAAQVEEGQAFIQRSQKRLERLQEEQVKEQQQLDTALARMARFREEMARTPARPTVGGAEADPTLTQPGKIPELVAELDRLRARVAEMEIERKEVRKKRSRSLSVPSPDLVGDDVSLQERGALQDQRVGQQKGALMETLISRGSTLAQSNRFSPLA